MRRTNTRIGIIEDWRIDRDMNAVLYRLESNFRCASAICDVANRLMTHQPGRLDKRTVSATGQAGQVIIHEAGFETDDAEAHAVAEDILSASWSFSGEQNFTQFAVLVRTNALSDFFRGVLKAHGLPVRELKRADLPADWQRAKAALALLTNPDNDRLAYIALKTAAGRDKADEVRRRALAEYKTINDLALHMHFPALTAADALGELAKMGVSRTSLDRIGKSAAMLPPEAGVADLVLAVGREEIKEDEGEGIVVTTIHSMKGREAESVWIPAVEDGLFPCPNEDHAESRRLLFVAITRARNYLWLSWAKKRTLQWKGIIDRQPSRFLKELT